MKIEPFEDASERYLNWLGTKLTLVPTEVEKRRTRLAASTPFEFLRATFYRWAQVWPEVCPELNRDKVPLVLGVGDLHAENFGTWRDGEGRLVWGVNDFDECGYLPYTNDLVRLAASVRFGIEDQAIAALKKVRKLPGQKRRAEVLRQIKELRERKEVRKQVKAIFPAACRAILGGYCDGLNLKFKADKESMEQTGKGREPIILAERHDWLREIVLNKLRGKTTAGNDANAPSKANDFAEFFAEMNALPPINAVVPRSAWDAINQTMPEPDLKFRLCKREAGLGSLGRQRFTAVVEQWCGGILVREAKSLAPSAWLWWDEKRRDAAEILYAEALRQAVRARDPWLRVYLGAPRDNWVVRRLGPDSGKVKLRDLPQGDGLEYKLWRAMGREIANVHLPMGDVMAHLATLNKDSDWLCKAAEAMAETVVADWKTAC